VKGVILAGGTGSRLFPISRVTNKHLLPIYNKPMIYYPLECMKAAGIEEVMLVTGGNNSGDFLRLLGNGHEFGFKNLNYAYQESAGGIAQALSLAEHFAEGEPICLILGDTILEFTVRETCENFRKQARGAKILLSAVENPRAYGIAELDPNDEQRVLHIIEKPKDPKSNWAVIGVYFYDKAVFDIIRQLKPSSRNELEITDVNNEYIRRGEMTAEKIVGWYADGGENIDFYLKASALVARSGANKPAPLAPTPTAGAPDPIIDIHHAQITVPAEGFTTAKKFYCEVLGLPEVEKPIELATTQVFWVRVGNQNVHIGIDQGVDRSRSRAHLAYEVTDLNRWQTYLAEKGIAMEHPTPFAGYRRFHIRDPFGNMVEFIQRTGF
jgi:glucose-1-phosphate thymidylyltransferase